MQGLIKGKEDVIAFKEIDITRDRAAAAEYRVQATPTLVVLDSQGEQVKLFVGVPRESDLKAVIDKAMASQAASGGG